MKIVRSGPSRYRSNSFNTNRVDKSWIKISPDSSKKAALNPGCNCKAFRDDLLLAGSSYQLTSIFRCFDSTWRRIMGYGAPMVILVVRNVGSKLGCSLGPLTDYVVVETKGAHCIAHELGHACNLLMHDKKDTNLMVKDCGGDKLKTCQVKLL